VCMKACAARPNATGCEVIWSQGNRGCYIHTQAITEGNGVDRHLCAIFKRPGWVKGFCTLNRRDQNSGVIKVNSVNGNTQNAQMACMKACRARPGATGCEVIWDQGNRGCYIHTQRITEGNGVGRHLCSIFKRRRVEDAFEDAVEEAGDHMMAPPIRRSEEDDEDTMPLDDDDETMPEDDDETMPEDS